MKNSDVFSFIPKLILVGWFWKYYFHYTQTDIICDVLSLYVWVLYGSGLSPVDDAGFVIIDDVIIYFNFEFSHSIDSRRRQIRKLISCLYQASHIFFYLCLVSTVSTLLVFPRFAYIYIKCTCL